MHPLPTLKIIIIIKILILINTSLLKTEVFFATQFFPKQNDNISYMMMIQLLYSVHCTTTKQRYQSPFLIAQRACLKARKNPKKCVPKSCDFLHFFMTSLICINIADFFQVLLQYEKTGNWEPVRGKLSDSITNSAEQRRHYWSLLNFL